MSVATRSYSKESSHYSRSSSYHSRSNHRQLSDDRPLSSRLIERDWDDPFFFDRIRSRLDHDFFKWNYGLTRPIPIYYRSWNNSSSSKIIPIQYSPSSSSVNRRQATWRKSNNNEDFSASFVNRQDENSMSKKNRIFIAYRHLFHY